MFCKNCGTENQDSNKFCKNCGTKLLNLQDEIKISVKNNPTYQRLTDVNFDGTVSLDNKELVDFIQKNVEYYIQKFDKLNNNQTITWNWSAFIFGIIWLLYRKMYSYAIISFIISFILMYIPVVDVIVVIAYPFLCGLFGNTLYLKHIKKQFDSFENVNDNVRYNLIKTKGGVNNTIGIIFGIIWGIIFITMLMNFIFVALYSPYLGNYTPLW